jgi:hypothetical protein
VAARPATRPSHTQLVQHIANAFAVKIRQADTEAVQLLHCLLGAAIGYGGGVWLAHGVSSLCFVLRAAFVCACWSPLIGLASSHKSVHANHPGVRFGGDDPTAVGATSKAHHRHGVGGVGGGGGVGGEEEEAEEQECGGGEGGGGEVAASFSLSATTTASFMGTGAHLLLKAALRDHLLPRHLDALVRLLTLHSSLTKPRHLRGRMSPSSCSSKSSTFSSSSSSSSSMSSRLSPRVPVTHAKLAAECVVLMSLWFPENGRGATSPSEDFEPATMPASLLAALARPDKTAARLLSALTTCAALANTNGAGLNNDVFSRVDTLADNYNNNHSKNNHGDSAAARALLVRSLQLAVGVLLALSTALQSRSAMARWAPVLRRGHFFAQLGVAVRAVQPVLARNCAGDDRVAAVVAQLHAVAAHEHQKHEA